MSLKVIGVVKNGVEKAPDRQNWWVELVSDLKVNKSLNEALDGLEGFSHIIVLYWLHRDAKTELLDYDSPNDSEVPAWLSDR